MPSQARCSSGRQRPSWLIRSPARSQSLRRGASVDATLAVGAIPIDVASLGADTIFFAGDRWLLGPKGAERSGPGGSSGVGDGIVDHDIGRTSTLGLARSVGWLEMYVGLDWIYERGAALTRRLHAALTGTEGVEVVTPAEALATIVVFRLASWPVGEALDELRRRVFAIIGATPDGSALRASVAWFNTEEELDRFAAAVAEIARYTPETLPRRALAGRPLSGQPPHERSWVEIQWRKLRNPPPPVLRAVLGNLAIAAVGGLLLFVYATLNPGADLAPLVVLFILVVIVAGSLLTYLWVELPTGASGVRRRSAWAGILGFFASVPIAYLVLVVVFQVLLAGR